jgi:hypothetical protein
MEAGKDVFGVVGGELTVQDSGVCLCLRRAADPSEVLVLRKSDLATEDTSPMVGCSMTSHNDLA